MQLKKLRINFSTTQMIMLSFLTAILAGSALLSLPVSSADGKIGSLSRCFVYGNNIYMRDRTCDLLIYSTWSIFGQIIILIMIQVGGLGIVTILSGILISFNRRLGLNRILVQMHSI